MHRLAPAKLNLSLHVTGRRADGYHLLDSLVVFLDLADEVSVIPSDGLSLKVEGAFAEASGDHNDNLVLRAARLMQQHTGCHQGAALTLTKHIPVGAGLGGGSADAAAVLHLLNDFWELKLSDATLLSLAPKLGADVAMCLYSKPLIARGIGDEITLLNENLPPLFVVLVYPHEKLLSKDVYKALSQMQPSPLSLTFEGWDVGEGMLRHLATSTRNDLQSPAIRLSHKLAETLKAMQSIQPTPALVRMTGSGSCCFALFESNSDATAFHQSLSTSHPQWWVQKTQLIRW